MLQILLVLREKKHSKIESNFCFDKKTTCLVIYYLTTMSQHNNLSEIVSPYKLTTVLHYTDYKHVYVENIMLFLLKDYLYSGKHVKI